jgi:hypothetical protein
MNSVHVRNIALDLILALITCGLYNIYVQYKQIEALNEIVKSEKYNFMTWLLLTIVTCGLYHIYHEYRMTEDLVKNVAGTSPQEPLISLVLACFGLSLIVDAIQQTHINRHYGSHDL